MRSVVFTCTTNIGSEPDSDFAYRKVKRFVRNVKIVYPSPHSEIANFVNCITKPEYFLPLKSISV